MGYSRSEPGFIGGNGAKIGFAASVQGKRNRQHGQGLALNFAQAETQIVSADIVVHGYPNSMFVVPATLLREDVTEFFHLTASEGAPLLHSSIWTKRLMVRWVELTRLEYADGTTWKPSAPHQCHAAPSLYLPVSSPR